MNMKGAFSFQPCFNVLQHFFNDGCELLILLLLDQLLDNLLIFDTDETVLEGATSEEDEDNIAQDTSTPYPSMHSSNDIHKFLSKLVQSSIFDLFQTLLVNAFFLSAIALASSSENFFSSQILSVCSSFNSVAFSSEDFLGILRTCGLTLTFFRGGCVCSPGSFRSSSHSLMHQLSAQRIQFLAIRFFSPLRTFSSMPVKEAERENVLLREDVVEMLVAIVFEKLLVVEPMSI